MAKVVANIQRLWLCIFCILVSAPNLASYVIRLFVARRRPWRGDRLPPDSPRSSCAADHAPITC